MGGGSLAVGDQFGAGVWQALNSWRPMGYMAVGGFGMCSAAVVGAVLCFALDSARMPCAHVRMPPLACGREVWTRATPDPPACFLLEGGPQPCKFSVGRAGWALHVRLRPTLEATEGPLIPTLLARHCM
eukprot:213750-Chlamydomonas_euryale.AAC.2